MEKRRMLTILVLVFGVVFCAGRGSLAGEIKAWGRNEYGQLGDGTTTNSTTPVAVSGLSGVTAIAAGSFHTVALLEDGTCRAWGSNYHGQLGDGTTTDRTTPVAVSGLTGVTAIAADNFHTVALLDDGTCRAWGHNGYGQLGDGTTTNRTTPVAVSGLTGVTAIAAGWHHTVALLEDGTCRAWGYNGYGQLGDGTTTGSTTPVAVSGLSGVVAIAAGGYHSLALKAESAGTAFTYQGRLIDTNSPADGLYDFQFSLYNSENVKQGDTVDINDLYVVDGYFTTALDFGSDTFNGDERWLEIAVRPGDNNDPNAFVTLIPRQEVTPTPYAIYAKAAESTAAGGYTETDPTVLASVKDGVDWSEVTSIPGGFADGVDDIGLTSESDPTVLASVKDGVDWSEVTSIPSGFADGVDDEGLASETDPQVGTVDSNYVPKWDGSALVTGTIYDNGNVGIGTPSPDATLQVNGTMKVFGGRAVLCDSNTPTADVQTMASGTAASDGFVVGMVEIQGSTCVCYIEGKVGAVVYGRASVSFWSGTDYPTLCNSFTMPVRKGESWSTVYTRSDGTTHGAVTVYWMPLGI